MSEQLLIMTVATIPNKKLLEEVTRRIVASVFIADEPRRKSHATCMEAALPWILSWQPKMI
jgi:hypothetical protein